MCKQYAFSDLHGRFDLLTKIYNFVKPEDKLYFLGDAADRGPRGWECIKTLLADNRVIYLKGNHEDMLVKAMRSYIGGNYYSEALSLLESNGGGSTFNDWTNEKDLRVWLNLINKLPTHLEFFNKNNQKIYLSHAGYSVCETIPSDYDLVWDREHFYTDSKEGLVVHGHTPVQLIREEAGLPQEEKIFWYNSKKKVCIDCGAVWTGFTYLLDLDTFEEIKIT